jgi:hypothetical protein
MKLPSARPLPQSSAEWAKAASGRHNERACISRSLVISPKSR